MSKSAVLGIIFLVEFDQLGLVAIQATRAQFNKRKMKNLCPVLSLEKVGRVS